MSYKNQTGKNIPIKRIKKVSRKGNKIQTEVGKIIYEITSIKNNLDQKLKDDNQDIVKENESAKKIQKKFREHKIQKKIKEYKARIQPPVNNEKADNKSKGNEISQEKAKQEESPAPSDDKDEDLEELKQTPKMSLKEIKAKWLQKFDDAEIVRKKLNLALESA